MVVFLSQKEKARICAARGGGLPCPAPATPRTSRSDPTPVAACGGPGPAAGGPPYAPMETQSDLVGYGTSSVPYAQGFVVGPRAVAREQACVQSRQEEEFAALCEGVDEPKPPTEAGCEVQAAENDEVPLRHRDTILRTAASHLSAVAAALNVVVVFAAFA